jgi:rhamnose utilization protein RhaD (predicted bifunctional aldolase and dehydrogenase)
VIAVAAAQQQLFQLQRRLQSMAPAAQVMFRRRAVACSKALVLQIMDGLAALAFQALSQITDIAKRAMSTLDMVVQLK